MATSDLLRAMATADESLTDADRLLLFYLLAVIFGNHDPGDNSVQEAQLAFANGYADAAEDDADAAEAAEAALNVTLTHRIDVDVPAAQAALTAKQDELHTLQLTVDNPTPEQSDEQSFLIAYQLQVNVP